MVVVAEEEEEEEEEGEEKGEYLKVGKVHMIIYSLLLNYFMLLNDFKSFLLGHLSTN